MDKQTIIYAIKDLMTSHDELMAGVGAIVVDYVLLNSCRIDGAKAIADLKDDDSEERLKLLDALEAGGIDNWDGYDFSLEDAGL